MNGLLSVNTGVKFYCAAAMQGAHHIFHLPITLYIYFYQRRRLAKEGLIDRMGSKGVELFSSELHVGLLPTTLRTCQQ